MKSIYKNNVKNHLKSFIKGKIKVRIENDTMIVTIYPVGLKSYTYKVYDLTATIVSGYPSSMLANSIVKEYKHYIKNQFFI